MNKQFNLNTIQILSTQSSKSYPIKVLVRGKLIGGEDLVGVVSLWAVV